MLQQLGKRYAQQSILISTAPPLADVRTEDLLEDDPDLVIQFLHTYPYEDAFTSIRKLMERYRLSRIVLVTAYEAYHLRLARWADAMGHYRLQPVYQPMFIDLMHITREVLERKIPTQPLDRIVYFGNLYGAKNREYERLSRGLKSLGWKVDVISKGTFKGHCVLDQEEIWNILRGYRYGIGVGRCALEMYALGLRVLISGAHWGGLCLTPSDWYTQTRSNFNGRVITGTRDLAEACDLLEGSLVPSAPGMLSYNAAEKLLERIDYLMTKNLQPWAAL